MSLALLPTVGQSHAIPSASTAEGTEQALDTLCSPTLGMGATAERRARRTAHFKTCEALNREWSDLVESRAHDAEVAAWGRTELAGTQAAGVEGLGDLQKVCRASSGATNDAILLTLLELLQGGDTLAGRLLLQLFLGKIVRMGFSQLTTAQKAAEYEADALEAFWTVMSSYPVARRQRSVAANLALDTLHQVRLRPRSIENVDFRLWTKELLIRQDALEDQDPTVRVLVLIRDGLQAGAISSDEAQLLAATYAPEAAPKTSEELGREMDLPAATLRRRTSRAVARLSTFVHKGAVGAPRQTTQVHGHADGHLVGAGASLPEWVEEENLLELMDARMRTETSSDRARARC